MYPLPNWFIIWIFNALLICVGCDRYTAESVNRITLVNAERKKSEQRSQKIEYIDYSTIINHFHPLCGNAQIIITCRICCVYYNNNNNNNKEKKRCLLRSLYFMAAFCWFAVQLNVAEVRLSDKEIIWVIDNNNHSQHVIHGGRREAFTIY